MLYIVDENSDLVLFSVDAWNPSAERLAKEYVREHNLKITENKITFFGDMILTVVGGD